MVDDLISLKKAINNLGVYETSEIKNIIDRHEITYTKNSNGIFINMEKFSDKLIADINNFIKFLEDNKQMLENKKKEVDEEKKNINISNRHKIQSNVTVNEINSNTFNDGYLNEYKAIINNHNTDCYNDAKFLDFKIFGTRKGRRDKFNGLKSKILKNMKEKNKKRLYSIDLMISSSIQLTNEERKNKRKKKIKRRKRKTSQKKIIIIEEKIDDEDVDVDDEVDDADIDDVDEVDDADVDDNDLDDDADVDDNDLDDDDDVDDEEDDEEDDEDGDEEDDN